MAGYYDGIYFGCSSVPWKDAFEEQFWVFKKYITKDGRDIYKYSSDRQFYFRKVYVKVEKIDEEISILKTYPCRYIYYNVANGKRRLNFASIKEEPCVNKNIELRVFNTTDYPRDYFLGHYSDITIVPTEIICRFSKYDMYIIKTEKDIYYCYLR